MILPINVTPGFTLLFTEHGFWASTKDGWVRFGDKIEAVLPWTPSVEEGTCTPVPVPMTHEWFREVLDGSFFDGPPSDLSMKAFLAEDLPPSDRGLSGAIPLPPDTWAPSPIEDADWAEQNRKINDLLMGRR